MPPPRSSDLCGGEVQYFRLEPAYWPIVLDRLVDAGVRTVTSYMPWETHCVSPPDRQHPAGEMDFEGLTDSKLNLRRFIELVQQRGLNLSARVGPFCCNEMIGGGHPQWLICGDPAMMVWDHTNRPTQGYWIARKCGMQPSYLHPDYLTLVGHWFAAVDRVLLPYLTGRGGCITMVNLDNEVSYIVKDSLLDSDYNPINVSRGGLYHQFLTERYGTVEALSDAHGHRYGVIEDAQPPRQAAQRLGRDFAQYCDWMRFKTWCMTRYLAQLRALHEANGIGGVRFYTNLNPHRPEGVPTRMADFQQAVGEAGLVGYDFYRGCYLSYSGYQSMARVLKLMNASLGYTWSAEFMSGTWNLDLSKVSRVSDDHMRFMARCALAHGCKAIQWFMFHDRDCWGDAPVSSHGHARPSLAVLQETVTLLRNRIPQWDRLRPLADVAIVYDVVQHLHTSLGDPAPCADNDLHIGPPAVAGIEAGRATSEYEGLFRLVEHCGCQAAVIDSEHDASRLSAFPLVILSGSPLISRKTAAALKAYVEEGGTLLVSGPWPALDETGQSLRLLDSDPKPTVELGKGRAIWCEHYLAQEPPEQALAVNVQIVRQLIDSLVNAPLVRIEPEQSPVTWVDWAATGGARTFEQPLCLASAVLHAPQDGDVSGGQRVLFVLSHYPVATRLRVTIASAAGGSLVNCLTGTRIGLDDSGSGVVDVDRKSADLFEVIGGGR